MNAIQALADYFTGPDVGTHSIGLSMPQGGMLRKAADRFYATRKALGVEGYMTAEEAAKAIRRQIEKDIAK